jgi:hypothetical protein
VGIQILGYALHACRFFSPLRVVAFGFASPLDGKAGLESILRREPTIFQMVTNDPTTPAIVATIKL